MQKWDVRQELTEVTKKKSHLLKILFFGGKSEKEEREIAAAYKDLHERENVLVSEL